MDKAITGYLDGEARPKPQVGMTRHQKLAILAVCMLVGVGAAVAYVLYMRMHNRPSSNSGDISNCPKGVTCSQGPVVTLKNPFVLPGGDTPGVLAGLGPLGVWKDTVPDCPNIAGGTYCNQAGKYNIEIGSTSNWALGFNIEYQTGCQFSESDSSGAGGIGGAKLDVSKTVMGVNPAVCTAQLPNWEVWKTADLDSINMLNGYVIIGRPKTPAKGWITLGDFVYSKYATTQPVLWASVPLFWTTQGTLSSNWPIGCTYRTFYWPVPNISYNTVNNGKFRYVVPFSAGNASTTAPDGFPDTTTISPYTAAMRNDLGFPSAGTPEFNMLTRLPRVGDIVANTKILQVTAPDMKLSDLLSAVHMSELHLPYLQALNKDHAGSYVTAQTDIGAVIPPGSHFLVAGLPTGYTDP